MKILAFSDTHLGWHTDYGVRFGHDTFRKVLTKTREEKPDIVIFCGDIAEPDELSLEAAMAHLREIPCKHKVMVAGNNDIEHIQRIPNTQFTDYIKIISDIARRNGVHLLDSNPYILGDYAFVGNFGFYDLSLWRQPKIADPNYPRNRAELEAECTAIHQRIFKLSHVEIFDFLIKRLRKHLQQVSGKKIVLCTHTVPTPEMVIYGKSSEYDMQNAGMGFNDSTLTPPLAKTPNLKMWLCGHTHRNHRANGTIPMINISGREQPHIFTL